MNQEQIQQLQIFLRRFRLEYINSEPEGQVDEDILENIDNVLSDINFVSNRTNFIRNINDNELG